MYGSSFGYSSSTLERMARWALDLTLDFAPPVMLRALIVVYRMSIRTDVLFFEHVGDCVWGLCGLESCFVALLKLAVLKLAAMMMPRDSQDAPH
jgi:hypothetical protein